MVEKRNVQAIRGWFATHRPDVDQTSVESFMVGQSFGLLAAGFEAGRHFQAEYPHLDPMNIAVYEPMHPIPDPPAPAPTSLDLLNAQLPVILEDNIDADIKPKSIWIQRRTKDECKVSKIENGIVVVADSFGDARRIPAFMFRQSYNPKGG